MRRSQTVARVVFDLTSYLKAERRRCGSGVTKPSQRRGRSNTSRQREVFELSSHHFGMEQRFQCAQVRVAAGRRRGAFHREQQRSGRTYEEMILVGESREIQSCSE